MFGWEVEEKPHFSSSTHPTIRNFSLRYCQCSNTTIWVTLIHVGHAFTGKWHSSLVLVQFPTLIHRVHVVLYSFGHLYQTDVQIGIVDWLVALLTRMDITRVVSVSAGSLWRRVSSSLNAMLATVSLHLAFEG